MPTIKY